MVDAHVRCRIQVDPHRTVRKQFGYTSWDWIEQKRGVMAAVPELEDYVDSLVDNGMNIQVQLMYGNVMYTSPSAASCPMSGYAGARIVSQ